MSQLFPVDLSRGYDDSGTGSGPRGMVPSQAGKASARKILKKPPSRVDSSDGEGGYADGMLNGPSDNLLAAELDPIKKSRLTPESDKKNKERGKSPFR